MGVNSPLPDSLDKECLKAARILKSFQKDGDPLAKVDQIIPPNVIEQAKGLVIMTVVKAGFLFSGRVGFGLVIARLQDGSWSAPSVIGTGSFGAGLQIGVELTDFVIILNNERAVQAFMHGGNVALGGNLSVAAGPVGRNAEGNAMLTVAAVYSYSKTKGAFAGISLEGTVFIERKNENAKFYGPGVTSKQLLTGAVPPPPAAAPLYDALRKRAARQGASGEVDGAANAFGNIAPPPRNSPAAPVARARALFDYNAQQAGDLGFKKGDVIEVTEKTNSTNDWWKGRVNNNSGSFPANYVQLL